MNISVLFEQSGTFKNILKAHGHNAKDFDIENKFNETDYQIDLFNEIHNPKSCIYKSDLIIAFFPCTYFSNYNDLIINGKWYNYKYMDDEQKNIYMTERKHKQELYTQHLLTLIQNCKQQGIPLIIENPVSPYFTNIIKVNNFSHVKHIRNKHGDNMRKPTYYLMLNGAKIENLDIIPTKVTRTIEKCNHDGVDLNRSLISTTYANNLIKHITIHGKGVI